jgi:hypothetical protein
LIDCKSDDYGFFLTLAASALADSWAAISASATLSALSSGSVPTLNPFVYDINATSTNNDENFISLILLI